MSERLQPDKKALAIGMSALIIRLPYSSASNQMLYGLFSGFAGIAQLVEHDLAKVGVASSSLVSRSNMQCRSHRVGRACSVLAKVGVASASLVAGSKNM